MQVCNKENKSKEAKVRLPIELIPNTIPQSFLWRNTVNTPAGLVTQECRGGVPPTIEKALIDLIGIAKQTMMENASLRGQIQGMADRIAGQSEILSANAERVAEQPTKKKGK